MKYKQLSRAKLELVVDKLGGVYGVKDFLSGKISMCVSEQALEVWKTINIDGDIKTDKDYCRIISNVGGKISNLAKDIIEISDFKNISQSSTEIDLCVASTEEILGGKRKSGTLSEIYEGIVRMGGELLSVKIVLQLRLQYIDQPYGELLMAMEPFIDSDGAIYVLTVRRDIVDLSLHAENVGPGFLWFSDYQWVFAYPRRK